MFRMKRILMLVCLVLVAAPSVSDLQTSAMAATSQSEIIEAARREGELSWADAIVIPSSASKMMEAFKKRYGLPNLKLSHYRLSTTGVSSRVIEEVRANRITLDIFGVAVSGLYYDLKKADALLRYDSPEYRYYEGARKAGLTFEPGYWQSAVAYFMAPITNPKFYPKKITSWYDLLDPSLKGQKIRFSDVGGAAVSVYSYMGWRKVLPLSYFESLIKQELIVPATTSVDDVQKVLMGEYLVAMTSPFRLSQLVSQTGVYLDAHFPKEGVVPVGQPYAILAKAPHPNVAKLFMDFLYSQEGMSLYLDLEGVTVLRDGVKIPEKIKRYAPPLAEIKTIPLDWKSLDPDTLDSWRQEWRKVSGRS